MYIIKWRNKFSNETGYVESISARDKHFINTFDESSAKKYSSMAIARRMITTLSSYGEAENNDFDVVKV